MPAAERDWPGDAALRMVSTTEFWDDYWLDVALPQEVRKGEGFTRDTIVGVFDRHLPRGPTKTALELGGAPGAYAAYVHRNFDYDVFVLDSSSVGCAKTRENFRVLGIAGGVFEGDLFETRTMPSSFDLVYSLGLIEHFTNLTEGLRAHVRFARPGGMVIVGAPNFAGIYGPLFRTLAPKALATVRMETMQIESWTEFEQELGLDVIFRGCLGGVDPRQVSVIERHGLPERLLATTLRRMAAIAEGGVGRFIRRWDSRLWSAYLLGVYRVPSER